MRDLEIEESQSFGSLGGWTDLAVCKLEDQEDLVAIDLLRSDLGGHPALCDIWLPCFCANIITVRHLGCLDGRSWPGPNVRQLAE
jgi:hypothetical protein